MKLNDIHLRDPFVLVHEGRYYLYGSCGRTLFGRPTGFDVYVSEDMENWSDPVACFEDDGTFWAKKDYWAPEVHKWNGAFYLFASFLGEGMCRGTAILRSESPLGPFVPHSDKCVTPADWECLDGTLYADKAGKPWMVFCHEWTQIVNGEVCAMPLTADLKMAAGEPRVLWRAKDVSWGVLVKGSDREGYVTDGPFLWRTENGTLLCLWSSFSENGYTQALTMSDNGEIDGNFVHLPPLKLADAGHGMLFRDLQGQLWLTLHSPNTHPQERPQFIRMKDIGSTIACVG
ncbi:MAG: family 43 glycosylhydrolase [Chloroflexi bacterium]|nr:family 43 glycosylhydrolase [Chloroflexota bacterium]